MIADEAFRDRFAVRYYRWALADFFSEIDAGFPRIREITGPQAWRLLSFMDLLQPDEKRVLASGLVKRWNTRAVTLTKESPTQAELASVEAFIGWAPGEMTLQEREIARQKAAGNWSPATRQNIRRILDAELSPALGSRQKGGSGEATYVRELAGLELHTIIDTGARTSMLSYGHLIVSNGRRFWPEYISVFSWMGVAGQTDWSDIRDAEVSRAVRSLRDCCELFINVLPSLVSGPIDKQ
ncbi:MAG TPA: hypothetical protein VGI81_03665 [Tepidisphaeraceae bacterium]|jgi:hypothetical protein